MRDSVGTHFRDKPCRWWLVLTACDAHSGEPRQAYTRSMAEGSDRTRVLVVDDEANLVELVQGYLEREGYAVVTAADGPTAVALTREAQPDLIVLDLMLPGFDGLEVCRRVRQFSDAYILMLTARAEEIDKV